MVVTDLPFARADAIQSRYILLTTPASPGRQVAEKAIDKDSQEYAAFLKEKERRCGPDGFLDSGRYQHSFQLKQGKDSKEVVRPRAVTTSSVEVSLRKDRDQRDYERTMKVIEDHMWQHKQEERELKRIEGDIIKNQRTVKRTLRDYENAINRKKMSESRKILLGMDKSTQQQNARVHEKEEITKNRIEANVTSSQARKDIGRKAQLLSSSLARRYVDKMNELKVKKSELDRLNSDYESKIHRKEEEQLKIKQELADMAISLNMETLKGMEQKQAFERIKKKETTSRIKADQEADMNLENKLQKTEGDTKHAEVGRRKLSADLTLKRSHLNLKKREEGRHLQDTNNRLRANVFEQKQLNDAAMYADLAAQQRKIDSNMIEHDARRNQLVTTRNKEKLTKSEAHESHFSQKAQKRLVEQTRREHEEGLKFFQKSMSKSEERELVLYNKVRNAEYARQKQEQIVKRLQSKLNDVKKLNAHKIKQEMTELSRKETELANSLQKEAAALAKVHAERENSYSNLQQHRERLREDRYKFDEHNREHSRLMRIDARTEVATA